MSYFFSIQGLPNSFHLDVYEKVSATIWNNLHTAVITTMSTTLLHFKMVTISTLSNLYEGNSTLWAPPFTSSPFYGLNYVFISLIRPDLSQLGRISALTLILSIWSNKIVELLRGECRNSLRVGAIQFFLLLPLATPSLEHICPMPRGGGSLKTLHRIINPRTAVPGYFVILSIKLAHFFLFLKNPTRLGLNAQWAGAPPPLAALKLSRGGHPPNRPPEYASVLLIFGVIWHL